MLPKINRFAFRGAFPKKIVHTPLVTIRYEKNQTQLQGAVVVSKKVSKKATDRNRLRRVISNALYEYKNMPYSIVIFVKKGALIEEKKAFQEYMNKMFSSLLK